MLTSIRRPGFLLVALGTLLQLAACRDERPVIDRARTTVVVRLGTEIGTADLEENGRCPAADFQVDMVARQACQRLCSTRLLGASTPENDMRAYEAIGARKLGPDFETCTEACHGTAARTVRCDDVQGKDPLGKRNALDLPVPIH